jgi:hypothetical protein
MHVIPSVPQPQDAYGLEKLVTEELSKHYNTDFGIECRMARFHNIYGPYGTWKGGREKAPAAFCRKVGLLPGCCASCCLSRAWFFLYMPLVWCLAPSHPALMSMLCM